MTTKCKQRQQHRAAQNRYVAKNPAAQRQRVARSPRHKGTPAGAGKHGHKVGRPRKC